MGDIFQKAQQEHMKGFYQEIPDKLESFPADTPDWRDTVKNVIDDIIQSSEKSLAMLQPAAKNPGISPAKNPRPYLCVTAKSSSAQLRRRMRNFIAASGHSIRSCTNLYTMPRKRKGETYS